MSATIRDPKKLLATAAAVMCLIAAACSGAADERTDSGSSSTPAPQTPTTSATSPTGFNEPLVTDATDPAAGAVTRAVDTFVTAGSYAFDATMAVVVAGQPEEIELHGWVDDADRELVLRSGDDEVITRVIDGVATVERNGVVTAVPLEEADEAPSIEILKALQYANFDSATEVSGKLNAPDLKASGFDFKGSANVTIFLTTDFALAGYTMAAGNGTWSVKVRFFDNVETRDRLTAFIAALEDVLADTPYEGRALAEPGLFIAAGRLLCEELPTGTSPEDFITRYVEALADVDIDFTGDDDLVLTGALLGVSVAALCPEHTDALDLEP